MSVSEFELIVLENGDIGLQQVGEGDLLVRVNFSPEVKRYLGEQQVEVAKRMIDSGIKAVIEMEQSDIISLEREQDITLH
jgi:hypothetical protein